VRTQAARVDGATSCRTTQTKRSLSKRLGGVVLSLIARRHGRAASGRAAPARRPSRPRAAPIVAEQGRQHRLPVGSLGAAPRAASLRSRSPASSAAIASANAAPLPRSTRRPAASASSARPSAGAARPACRRPSPRAPKAEGLLVAGVDEGVGAGQDRGQRRHVGDERQTRPPLAGGGAGPAPIASSTCGGPSRATASARTSRCFSAAKRPA
jgi:hypothetical protein